MAKVGLIVTGASAVEPQASVTRTLAVPGDAGAEYNPVLLSMLPPPLTIEKVYGV
jgi:hypothetical protein